MNEKIVGEWDGRPIVRPLTPEERLLKNMRQEGKLDLTDEQILEVAELGRKLLSNPNVVI